MADFVAVIRRAVDGLSDNTPELRAKVYDKARSAVLRQLESMKPRPPEEMLRRQLDKLEAAILDVESEHAEALAPEEDAELIEAETLPMETGAGPAPDEAEPTYAAPEAPEPVHAPEAAPAAEPQYVEPPYIEPQPVAAAAPARAVEVAARPAATQNYLYGDESWAGEEEEAETAELRPYPAPAPVAPAAPLPLAVPVPSQEVQEPAWAPQPQAEPEAVEDAPPAQSFEPSEPVETAYEEDRQERGEPVQESHHDLVETVPAQEAPEHEALGYEAPEHEVLAQDYQQDAARDEAAIYAYQEEETYPDFPVEEPTEKYSHPFVETPASPPLTAASPEHWPEGGVESPVTATLEQAEWTAPARFEPETDAPPQTEVAGMSFAEQAELEPQDPFGWTPPAPEPAPAFVHEEPAYRPAEVQAEPVLSAEDELRAFGYEKPAPAPMEEFVPVPEAELPKPLAAERAQPVVPEPVHEPVVHADTLLPGRSDSSWDESPFVDVPLPGDADNGAARGPETVRSESPQEQRGWDEFEEYAAYDASKPEVEPQEEDYIFTPVEKPTRSYRIEQRRRYDFTSLGLGLLGLLLVAGSGYGAWVFRDTLSGLVTGLVSTPPSQETKATTTPASSTPATDAASGATPATTTPSTPQTSASTPVPSDLAATQAESDIQKFTQRLQADGSEVDEGKADGAAAGEGTSVAPQTVASNDPVDTTLPATTPATPANTSAAAIPAGASQKMYLYEERLGQTSPVAVEGSVVWTLKHETADNGKSEAIVQGQVTAPDRGLSALITFKRNLDPSLPASHLVELVFSLPKDFDGGAIASVQRVALKENEQDRGDPLVAVPAKITDDFHMIALNDYPDARAFNLRLLQTRNWIDIPLTYRNGRRALLTMDKGAAGAQAFNQAISEWQAEEASTAPVPASQPSAPSSAPATTQGQQPAPAPANP